MIKQLTLTNLFNLVTPNTTILTPNRRLTAHLQKSFAAMSGEMQTLAWPTPDILPITSWIERLWLDYTRKTFEKVPLLLNQTQEQWLWEQILLATKESKELLRLTETADLTKTAWGLLKQWRIDLTHSIFQSSEDYATLLTWINTFQTHCEKQNWIDSASLPDLMTPLIMQKKIFINPTIILVGFTEISPQYQQLFNTCQKIGSEILNVALIKQTEKIRHKISLPDFENEIITIAQWAKSTFNKNPQASIGCVIPNLDKTRSRVLQIFSEVFADECTYTVNIKNAPFNLSAGKSLAQYPLIQAAMILLSLHKQKISLETMSTILASPFVGDAENERIKRSHFDRYLRQMNISQIDLIATIQKDCPRLTKRIKQFFSLVHEVNKYETYTRWAEIFTELLTVLGWPGERSLISNEYQVVETWLNVLNEFKTLDQLAQPATIDQALAHLQKRLNNTIFQPQTPDAPIQVLGLLEAAGLPFNYLWVAGLDDLSWPPQPKPHPLIPKSLQRELQMPHATAERELLFCQLLMQQFNQSAEQIIFSHAEKNDELELQASPLIQNYSPLIDLELDAFLSLCQRIYNSKNLTYFIDDVAPAINANEKIRGGVSIIKHQALCPFKAFAEWRLHAHPIESPLPGLRAKDRGDIIHKTLELIWNEIKTHETLISMEEEVLAKLITDSIEKAMDASSHTKKELIEYITLEKKRLHKLISDWLALEKERPPFKVLHHELKTEITLDQLALSLRIDRIDELENGKKLIIDYKTGKYNDINQWLSDRPAEPQLPLYALKENTETIGISFAQISPFEHSFKGISQLNVDISGIKLLSEIKKATALSWDEQLQQWKNTLLMLSQQFYQGHAEVDPKETETCVWCKLKPLCRVNQC